MGVLQHLVHTIRRLYEDGTPAIRVDGIDSERWSTQDKGILNLRYADDTTLLASTRDEIEVLLRQLEITALDFGLGINRDKTKMMIVDRANINQPEVQYIAGSDLVNSYVYLGSTVTNDGGCEDEIRRRCAVPRSSVERLTKIWSDCRITKNTKVRLMICLVFPIFLYGAETWTLRQDRRMIDALERIGDVSSEFCGPHTVPMFRS
ncbi:uncharacterized protein LOC119630334 [Bombyx mori]|nr:uncharacterized protein LOC119630333 [Bombyx mori]